jgi:hypothetical protein
MAILSNPYWFCANHYFSHPILYVASLYDQCSIRCSPYFYWFAQKPCPTLFHHTYLLTYLLTNEKKLRDF